jgi:hypothetical protein
MRTADIIGHRGGATDSALGERVGLLQESNEPSVCWRRIQGNDARTRRSRKCKPNYFCNQGNESGERKESKESYCRNGLRGFRFFARLPFWNFLVLAPVETSERIVRERERILTGYIEVGCDFIYIST